MTSKPIRLSTQTIRQPRVAGWTLPAAEIFGAFILVAYGISTTSTLTVFIGGLLGALAMLSVRRDIMPAIALWLLVLLPIGFMDVPGLIGDFFTPSVLVILIWLFRVAIAERMTLLLRVPIHGLLIAIPFLAFLSASAIASERIDVTLVWLAVFVICVVLPALVGQVCFDDVWQAVRWSLAGIGLFLGILASVDFLFHFNPWAVLYQDQLIGSSVFRTRTSLGHPLTTAMVASVALAACAFPSSKGRQWPYWVCALGALIAVVLSVSRTSVIAVSASAIVGLLSAIPRTGDLIKRVRGRGGRLTAILMAAIFVSAVALSPLMRERNVATEGISSATYRSQVLDAALDLIAERPLLGFGPGTSTRIYESYTRAPLENSALQLAVSIGLPAFILCLVGMAVIITVAMRRGRAGPAAGIVAFMISAAGFNILDASPAFLALLAPLIICAIKPQPQTPPPLVAPIVKVSSLDAPHRRQGSAQQIAEF